MNAWHVHPDATASVQALACDLVRWLRERRGEIHLALSGGNTPLRLYAMLAAAAGIPWPRVHLWWVDERLVPPDDPRSNYGAARSLLVEPLRLAASRIHRIRGEVPPEQAAADYDRQLAELAGAGSSPVFDCVLLGVGEDGHTASLFPDTQPGWTGRHCLLARHLDDGTLRVSLNEATLLAAARVVFLVAGAGKRSILARILSGNAPELPASRIIARAPQVHAYLDAAAAPDLTSSPEI